MRNVFVSYAHRLDQNEVDDFRRKYGQENMIFSDRSLDNLDLSHLSDETIKNNYIRPKLRNSSVTIVLIGAETGGRWWVDWEIYCSLRKSNGNERNGILVKETIGVGVNEKAVLRFYQTALSFTSISIFPW